MNAGADTIEFAAAIQGDTITLAGGELMVASDVTIDGGTGVTIDADQLSRVLSIARTRDDNQVALETLTITGGKTTADRAAVAASRPRRCRAYPQRHHGQR